MIFSFNFYSLFFLLFYLTSCGQNNRTPDTVEKKMNQSYIYGIDYSINNRFEILINDELVAKNNEDINSSAFLPINELLLSGIRPELKIRLYNSINEQYIREDIYKYFNLKIVLSNNNMFENFITIQDINIPKVIKNKEFVEYTFLLEIDSDKLNPIVGWSKSNNLVNENQKILLNELYDNYNRIFKILNSGNYQEFYKNIEKREKEIQIAYFDSPEILSEQEDEKERVSNAKNKMVTIDFSKYKLKFYGNGKMITLEDDNGDSPLFYEKDNVQYFFGIVLHRPKAGAPLEIIR